jgi:hypothetical protein
LDATFEAGKTYSLTAAIGQRLGSANQPAPDNFAVQIKTASNTLLASYAGTASDLTAGVFVDKTISYTVGSNDAAIGQNIRVLIGMDNTTGTASECFEVDNVRLTATPEPGTLVLMATGLFGLLAYAWRKRK